MEQLIRSKINLIDYIHKHNYTDLEQSGKTIRGICPICHGTNRTEFVVNKEVYYCHSCKRSGNVISFVADVENLTYEQAIEKLADELNIDYENNHSYQERKSITTRFYSLAQDGVVNVDKALDYLQDQRGLTLETIKKFELGYDEFKITIPLIDIYGRYVGLAKRKLDGTKPKYTNNKNNALFDKSAFLFNINNAKKKVDNCLYVCEGYFDCISLDQMGYPAIAYMGSELTVEQIMVIKSVCINPNTTIIIIPDNDIAGKRSIESTRVHFQKLASDLDIQLMILPESIKDINELMCKGKDLSNCRLEHIDLYCLKEKFLSAETETAQYKIVERYIPTVKNPMVRIDIANWVSNKWGKDFEEIKKWFNVLDKPLEDSVLNKIKTPVSSLEKLQKAYQEGFFTIGFPVIDASLRGCRRGDVMMVGADPGVGKTTFAREVALHFAIRLHLPVVFFSLEMSDEALIEGLTASFLGISIDELQVKMLTEEYQDIVIKVRDAIEKYIVIIDEPVSLKDIKKYVTELNATYFSEPIALIVIDYIQYMKGTDTREELAKTAKGLKPLAKSNKCLVLCLSQLSRNSNSWERPTKSRMKGAGEIEATADHQVMLYKPADNPLLDIQELERLKDVIMAYIAKARRGAKVVDITLKFNEKTSRLREDN